MSIDIYVCLTVERRPWKGWLDMRVTKAQAEQNRAHIVATAARLFRERGYDGVGVAELMAAAGFTHGGFYKHFRSKADLMAEASASGLSQIAARTEGLSPAEFVESYVSREHRDGRSDGCTIAALSGDAARQSADIKTEFAAGIENLLTALQAPSDTPGDADQREARTMVIDMLAHSVGAVMLSRACPDGSPLADEILDVCRKGILASLAHGSSDQSAARSPEA
jgi:TetR/AcrR family transcriptional repressor of nem operon